MSTVQKRSIGLLVLCTLLFVGCAGNTSRSNNINRVIQTAKSYTGTPYKWGGTTRVGLDCSALIYHSYRSIGIDMPRVTADQSKRGDKVRLKQLAVGDLVFFATGDKKRKVTHAGIVTSVSGKNQVRFIHASTSLGVIESNLYSPYYLKRFLSGRRIL
ncbi:C40 family peptidase [Roseivirga sp.]|uniref:C40 family peptidase n=1 Tax=Roseivirga sp. TaxID=1964215 RepID=UPI003B8C41A0